MAILILTVQSTGNNSYRLGINLHDSKKYFEKRRRKVSLIIEGVIIDTLTTCGPPLKKGFDLYSQKISQWIVDKSFNIYPSGKPTKLEFELRGDNNTLTLIFIGKLM